SPNSRSSPASPRPGSPPSAEAGSIFPRRPVPQPCILPAPAEKDSVAPRGAGDGRGAGGRFFHALEGFRMPVKKAATAKRKSADPDARRQPLRDKVAVVAGATRGAGRGIARALGEAGATVYCTGRSVRGQPSPYGRPETIEETAELVTAAGGAGVAARVDHA